MGTTRTRIRVFNTPESGRYYISPAKQWYAVSGSNAPIREECTDTVGNRTIDNSFLLEKRGVSHFIIDGTNSTGSYIYENCPTQAGAYGAVSHGVSPLIAAGEINGLALSLVAKSNPNAPDVSVPAFVVELRDLPGLLGDLFNLGVKHLKGVSIYPSGENFARDLATKHLQWRWGVKTLISDLAKALQFSRSVVKRLRWLQQLQSSGSLRRNVALGTYNNFWYNPSVLIWSSGTQITTGSRTVVENQRTWGSINWSLADPSVLDFDWDVTSHEKFMMMDRLAGGLTPQGLTLAAWEVLPWSWFVDWMIPIQALLNASMGGIPVTHSRICLMRRTDTIETASPVVHANIKPKGAWMRWRTTKVRTPVSSFSPLTVSYLPLFEGDKWSILGSLAILRRLPSRSAI